MSTDDDGGPEDDGAILDELTNVVVEELGPVVGAYRRAVGRRLGLDPVELLCIDLLRARGTVTASLIGERTGLTRGGVTKLVRRLELAGHLVRRLEPDRQELMVVLRAHPERDAVLDGLRRRLRRRLVDVVPTPRRDRVERRAENARRERAGETPWWER